MGFVQTARLDRPDGYTGGLGFCSNPLVFVVNGVASV